MMSITDIHNTLAERKTIAIIWSIEDVHEIKPGLTDAQAWDVLQSAKRNHDAETGINHDVLRYLADCLFPEDEEQE